eukprot:12429896-Alexandrium_andersonii.AAC.1
MCAFPAAPSARTAARGVAIFKKGDTCDPANLRPISLPEALYKARARMITTKQVELWPTINRIASLGPGR